MDIYKNNLSAQSIIRGAINRSNKQFNPSLNLSTEALSGEPSDRGPYDYAGTEQELPNNQ